MKSVASCLPRESNKKITNHSTRKTIVAKLKNAGQPRHKIIQITGHARGSSLDDYDEITVSERRELSHIASGYVPAQSSSTSAISSTSASSTPGHQLVVSLRTVRCLQLQQIHLLHAWRRMFDQQFQSVQTKFLQQPMWQNSPVCRRPCTAWSLNRISLKFLTGFDKTLTPY